MTTGRGTVRIGLVVSALFVAACTASADPPPDPTEPATPSPSPVETPSSPAPSPSPSPTPDDLFALPDEVDAAYVDLVVNTLQAEWGAITREILAREPEPGFPVEVEVRERIAIIFDGQYLHRRLGEADALLQGIGRDGLLPADEFDQLRFATRQVKAGDHACIVAVGDLDASGTSIEAGSMLVAVSLSRTGVDNPTGWRMIDLLPNTGGGQVLPDDVMLNASIEDFGEALITDCDGEDVG